MSTVVSLICLGPSFKKMTHHFLLHGSLWPTNLETRGLDLKALKHSPDLLNNVKIGQDQLPLIMKHNLFNGGYGYFG